jgi:hypothetical protein
VNNLCYFVAFFNRISMLHLKKNNIYNQFEYFCNMLFFESTNCETVCAFKVRVCLSLILHKERVSHSYIQLLFVILTFSTEICYLFQCLVNDKYFSLFLFFKCYEIVLFSCFIKKNYHKTNINYV